MLKRFLSGVRCIIVCHPVVWRTCLPFGSCVMWTGYTESGHISLFVNMWTRLQKVHLANYGITHWTSADPMVPMSVAGEDVLD